MFAIIIKITSPNATARALAGALIGLSCQGNSTAELNGVSIASKRSEDEWTGTANLSYRPTDDVMVYARYAKGFKSGGFNGRANNPGEQAPYNPETVDSYEAGVKAKFWDGKARTALTVFYNDYQDFQARVSGTVTDPITNLPSPELTVINAGSLVTKGVEFELYVTPMDGLQLDTQVGYLDADYEEFTDVRFTNFGGTLDFHVSDAGIKELFPGADMTRTQFTYQLSDHFPVWVQIKTDIDGERLTQIVQNARKG